MAFTPHYRLTAIGRLGGPDEHFSYGLSIGEASSQAALPPLGQDLTVFNALEDATRAFHHSANAHIGVQAVLTTVKLAAIGADGKYLRDPIQTTLDVQTAGGGGDDPFVPVQTALAVSLVSGKRGPSGKGRFYLPHFHGQQQPGTFQITQQYVNEVEAATLDWLRAVNAAVPAPLRVVIASTLGGNSAVTAIRCGRIIDTMRSRRRSLSEGYQTPVPL